MSNAVSPAKKFAGKLARITPRAVCNKLGFYYIRNRDVAREARLCALSRKLEGRYRDILEAPVEAAERCNCNRIWVCWMQGFDSAPDVVKACRNSLKRNLPGREIVELDESNLHQYVHLPDYIEEKYRNGAISRAHYTDLVRLDLLCRYGGVWIDATVLCTSAELMPVIDRAPLFVFRQYRLAGRDAPPIAASNWFIGSVSNHPILLLTKKLLYAYWKRESRAETYNIFHLFFALATRRYPEEWAEVPPYNNISPHMLHYEARKPYAPERWEEILRISPFHKLSYRLNTSDDEASMYVHAIREYLPD